MRIALVNPRMSWSSVVPTGLLSIGTILNKDGHTVRVFDAYYPDEVLFERIKIFQPDLIGVSFLTTEYPRASKFICEIRNYLPQACICAGGYHVSALPEKSLRDLPLDFVVLSEGEITMAEICNQPLPLKDKKNISGIAYLDQEGNFVQTARREFIKNLDDLPMIDRELLDGGMKWYLTPPGNIRGQFVPRCTTILTSRGCPGNCLFCSSRAMWTNRLRQRSVDNVLDEIEFLIKKYEIKGLFFLDDTFTSSKKWIIEFCKRWKERNIQLKWGCSARVDTINEEILIAMKNIGCVQLDFGVESGNDEVLKTLKKGQNRKKILSVFKLIRQFGFKSLACFIIGSPGETEKQMFETLRLAKQIKANFNIFSILTPLPGSPLYKIAIDNGWISEKDDFNINWSIRHSEKPVMGIEMPPSKLIEIRKKFEDQFFLRNYYYYLSPLLQNPGFLLALLYQVFRKPDKYWNFLAGTGSRRFSGFVESVYYDYKEYQAQKLQIRENKKCQYVKVAGPPS